MGNAIDFIDSSNIGVGKCLKKSGKYIFKSYGFYISLFIILMHTIMSVLYFAIDSKKIQIYIYEITNKFLKYISSPEGGNISAPPTKKNNQNSTQIEKVEKEEEDKIDKKKKKKKKQIEDNKLINLNLRTSNRISEREKDTNHSFLKLENKTKKKKIFENNFDFVMKRTNSYNNNKKFFEEYFAESLDEMEFDDAIKEDHRKYTEYLEDCLKEKQIILNTFWANDLFKPRSIKVILFCLTIFLYFVVNALFINDDYVSEVYNLEEDKFFDFVPRSFNRFFLGTLVGIVIEFVVDFFFVEEKKMKGIFRREKDDPLVIKEEIVYLANLIKKRIIYFIIFVYVVLIICLYYLLCFNSIYPHMQIEWIKSSIFIIFIRQILSVIQCISETTLRILSFKYESEKLFKISKLIN
jgi:hypothetical protein